MCRLNHSKNQKNPSHNMTNTVPKSSLLEFMAQKTNFPKEFIPSPHQFIAVLLQNILQIKAKLKASALEE